MAGTVGTETAKVLRIDGAPYRPGTTVGLSGLQQVYQRFLVGTPTTEVVAENAAGHQVSVLKSWPGSPGKPVADDHQRRHPGGRRQRRRVAARVRGDHRGPCLRRQDSRRRDAPGARHASGQRAGRPLPAGPGLHHRLHRGAGQHRLQARHPDTVHKRQIQVGGRTFTNSPPESGLGTQPPFGTDFARACSTAFAGLSLRLNPSELTSVGRRDVSGSAHPGSCPCALSRARWPASRTVPRSPPIRSERDRS